MEVIAEFQNFMFSRSHDFVSSLFPLSALEDDGSTVVVAAPGGGGGGRGFPLWTCKQVPDPSCSNFGPDL